MNDYFEWIDNLCHRFHHLTQIYMNKPFIYDFKLADGASKHSEYLANKKNLEHSNFNGDYKAENICKTYLLSGDEEALHKAIMELKADKFHRINMERFDVIGIGIAVDTSKNMLYITQRFR